MDDKKAPRNKIKLIATFGLPIVWGLLLMLFFNVTSPLQSGPFSVLVAFVLIYLLFVSVLYVFAFSGVEVARFLGWHSPLSFRTLYYLTSVISLGPVFLLALNTLGQLDIKDIILIIILLAFGCFYVIRRGKKETA